MDFVRQATGCLQSLRDASSTGCTQRKLTLTQIGQFYIRKPLQYGEGVTYRKFRNKLHMVLCNTKLSDTPPGKKLELGKPNSK